MGILYDVYTDAKAEELSDIAVKVFMKWIMFAMGATSLQGKRIKSPTGKYASSIKIERQGPNAIAVIADETIAPEAEILEYGHPPIDLKRYPNLQGRTLPMHRGLGHAGARTWGSQGYGPAFVGSPFAKRTTSMWAKSRAGGSTGFARVPSKITKSNSSSWVIPAMAAYQPSKILADMIQSGQFSNPNH